MSSDLAVGPSNIYAELLGSLVDVISLKSRSNFWMGKKTLTTLLPFND
jgi:hypothetical protein